MTIQLVRKKTQRQKFADLGKDIVAYKDGLAHSCSDKKSAGCLKCDVNKLILGAVNVVQIAHFPKEEPARLARNVR